MFKSLIRTLAGPSRDPRMAYISRPLPRYLPDAQVLAALGIALAEDPRPETLVETLPPALRQVTGHAFSVLDRSSRDVTGAYRKTQVMIRDGEVGLWPGYKARAYPLLAQARRDAPPAPTNPVGKPGWAPPRPVGGNEEDA